jgi:hypothetical protein
MRDETRKEYIGTGNPYTQKAVEGHIVPEISSFESSQPHYQLNTLKNQKKEKKG